MLRIENLTKRYGASLAVDNVSTDSSGRADGGHHRPVRGRQIDPVQRWSTAMADRAAA
jgi:hypothetical protein